VLWVLLSASTLKQLGKAAILYWFCSLFAVYGLFVPGILLTGLASWRRAWTAANIPSIKPLPNRPNVDEWTWPINWIYGNPEDGVSGRYAYGGWAGAYNPTGSRWKAFIWAAFRNWACGFNYLTWNGRNAPPLFVTNYTVWSWVPRAGGSVRQFKIGWQLRYGCTVMVGSA
jgi:hypothetical protein